MDGVPHMTRKSRLTWLTVVTLVVVGIDQWSKVHAVAQWKGQPSQHFFGDVFRIEYAENDGAFLSLLANQPPQVRFWVLTVFNGLLLGGVTLFLLKSPEMRRWTFFALALVVAGGVGNLIDRVRFGYVIDYFNLGLGGLRTGIFNVADMAISAGFIMLLPYVIWGDAPQKSAEKQPESPAAEGT